MTEHRMAVVGMRYPGFSSVPPLKESTVRGVARMVDGEGADVVSTSETGVNECARLAAAFGESWHYYRAQGVGGNGINGLFYDTRAWTNPHDVFYDWPLRSHGQWPARTLLLVRLAEVADETAFVQAGASHLAAVGTPLNRHGANAAKWDQVHQLRDLVGGKRVLIGMDFPRTDDDDDVAWLKRQGFTFPGRTDRTPMTGLAKGDVRVSKTRLLPMPTGLDHLPNLITFSLPGKADA